MMPKDKHCVALAGADVRLRALGDGVQGVSPTAGGSTTGQALFPRVQLGEWREPDEIPRVVGIHFFANKTEAPDPGGGAATIRRQAQAILNWGHTGGKFSSPLDVLQGQTVSVFGSYVEVLGINASEAVAAITPPVAMPMGCVICPEGPLANVTRPRFSVPFTGAASTIFNLPLWAVEVDLLRAVPAGAATVNFLGFGGATVLASVPIAAGTGLLARPIPIPNGATRIEFAAAGSAECEAIFYLGF